MTMNIEMILVRSKDQYMASIDILDAIQKNDKKNNSLMKDMIVETTAFLSA